MSKQNVSTIIIQQTFFFSFYSFQESLVVVEKMVTRAVREYENTKSPLKYVAWQPIKNVLVKVNLKVFNKVDEAKSVFCHF